MGNTLVKLAVMDGGACVAERRAEELLPSLVEELLAQHAVEKAIVSSTRGGTAEAAELLRSYVGRVVEFGPETPVPIRSDYRTPETLGRDRLAAAVGATVLCPGRDVLVVDCGTALTLDLVTADGTFRGGIISPGLRLRFKALHDCTAALPLCSPTECAGAEERPDGEPEDAVAERTDGELKEAAEALLGRTTREAIERGVMNSMAYEIAGYIDRLRAKNAALCVIFTGGDAKYLAKRIKNTIFANRNPVFCGLDRILEFNASEEDLE